ERPTLWFVARYSIQLSYGCEKDAHYREGAEGCPAFFVFPAAVGFSCLAGKGIYLRFGRSGVLISF
uniref:hypothetical protein n=2 Tax=Neisseria bacilliformis TaxID=267212 RepID=UPI0019552711